MDVYNDEGALTFTQEPEGNELSVAQVDDVCGKSSALVMKGTTGSIHTHSCPDKLDPWGKKTVRKRK